VICPPSPSSGSENIIPDIGSTVPGVKAVKEPYRLDPKGRGLGWRLWMIRYACSEGLTHAFNPLDQSLKLRPILPAVGRPFFVPSERCALSDRAHGSSSHRSVQSLSSCA